MQLLVLTAALSAIIALRYLATSSLVHALVWRLPGLQDRRLGVRAPDRRAMGAELRASLLASPIYALPAAVAMQAFAHGRGRLYADVGRYPLWWLPVSAALYLVLQDAYYYWLHRLMHQRWAFRWCHIDHHRSREPTAFASFAFDGVEAAATAWFLPALTFVIPIHVGVALAILALMTLSAVSNHCGFELLPRAWLEGPAGRWLISATHHSLHHSRPRCNYGLFFRAWDRWMGTDAMPATVLAPRRVDRPAAAVATS